MDTEVLLALGYAAFLLSCAWALRRSAHSPSSSRRRMLPQPPASDWARRQAAQFQSALSETLIVLAAFLLSVVAIRHRHGIEILPVGFALIAVGFAARGSLRRLWRRSEK